MAGLKPFNPNAKMTWEEVNQPTFDQVVRMVSQKCGWKYGMAVGAALEIAAKQWNKEDTIRYGTGAASALKELMR